MAQFPISQTASNNDTDQAGLLAWSKDDVENRFGFKGGRYTSVNHGLAFLIGALLTGVLYVLMLFVFSHLPVVSKVATIYMRPTNQFAVIPATFFFFGGMAVLILKGKKIKFQQRALRLAAVPAEPEFVLTESTAATVLARIHSLVDHPRHFVLLNRIDRALSNFKNMGQVNDVSAILRAQAENDEDLVASSYTVVNGLVWAIPVLGFIGTVLGLSLAIGRFTQTLQAAGDLELIRASLQGVTGGLATAFESTLVALTFTLILQLMITFQQKREMAFLDDCNDYCHSHIVAKLRLANRPADTEAGGNALSSRLRSLDSKISFFAFADIITAVSGVLIFVALLLATDLGRPTQRSHATNPELQQQLQATLAQQQEADADNRRLQALVSAVDTAPDPEKLKADIERLRTELESEQKKAKAVTDQMSGSEAAIATRDRALGLTDLKSTIHHKNGEAETAEQAEKEARAKLEHQQQQVAQVESQLLKLQGRDGQVWLIPDKSSTPKEPVLMTVSGAGVTIERFDHPDQRQQSDASMANIDLKTFLGANKLTNVYVVFLIRPSGIALFKELEETTRLFGFEVGYDALEEEREVHFSTPPPADETDTGPDKGGSPPGQNPPGGGGKTTGKSDASGATTAAQPPPPPPPPPPPKTDAAPPPIKSWWERLLEWAGIK